MSRVPVIKTPFEAVKTPKNIESPAKYKEFPISWQLSHIDRDGRWGLNIFKRQISFLITDNLLSELKSDINNDLYNAITDLNNKTFESIHDFLLMLENKCKGHISNIEQRIIIKSIQENFFWTDIYPKLRHFESQTWFDIEKEISGGKNKTRHHSVNISKIIPEARKRLEQLQLDDIDELFSIRLAGKLRIWGIRHYSYLRILWIDLEHEICPTTRS